MLAMHCAWLFGFGWQAAAAAILGWSLVALAMIDIRHQLLPDNITIPVLWLGIAVNLFHVFVPLNEAVIGDMLGYLVLWALFHNYRQ